MEPTYQDCAAVADGIFGAAVEDCGNSRDSANASTAAWWRKLSCGLRDCVGSRAATGQSAGRADHTEGDGQWNVHLRRYRREVRSAADGGSIRSRQAAL